MSPLGHEHDPVVALGLPLPRRRVDPAERELLDERLGEVVVAADRPQDRELLAPRLRHVLELALRHGGEGGDELEPDLVLAGRRLACGFDDRLERPGPRGAENAYPLGAHTGRFARAAADVLHQGREPAQSVLTEGVLVEPEDEELLLARDLLAQALLSRDLLARSLLWRAPGRLGGKPLVRHHVGHARAGRGGVGPDVAERAGVVGHIVARGEAREHGVAHAAPRFDVFGVGGTEDHDAEHRDLGAGVSGHLLELPAEGPGRVERVVRRSVSPAATASRAARAAARPRTGPARGARARPARRSRWRSGQPRRAAARFRAAACTRARPPRAARPLPAGADSRGSLSFRPTWGTPGKHRVSRESALLPGAREYACGPKPRP